MTKIFTLVLMLAVTLSVNAQKKKVGYYGLDKSNTGSAAMVPEAQTDPVLLMLQSDPNLEVTANLIASKTEATPAGWNDFDVVILQESPGSGDQLVKDLNINAVTKPYLINKSYGFKKGSLFTTGTGAGKEGTDVNLQVIAGKESHDLFKGITISGGLIKCFNKTTTDTGADGVKALNYNEGVVVGGGELLAQPNAAATAVALSFNDVPKGITIGDHTTNARIITVGMNYGAICANGNITNEGLTIWRNAVYILAGLTVPSYGTSVKDVKTSALTYAYKNKQVQVSFGIDQQADIAVYNITGQLVSRMKVNSTSATIDLGSQPKGIYIVNVSGSKVSGTQKFIVQ